jgi:hypothetical protein
MVIGINQAAVCIVLPLFNTARGAVERTCLCGSQRPQPPSCAPHMPDLEHPPHNPLAIKGQEVRCGRSIAVDLVLRSPGNRHWILRSMPAYR